MKSKKTTGAFSAPAKAVLTAIAVLLPLAVSGCMGKKDSGGEERLMVVEVVSPVREIVSETVTLTGTITAERRSMVASAIGGKVTAVLADVGDEVKKGQVLMRLDASSLAAQREQAANMLKSAKLQLEVAGKGARPEEIGQLKEQLAAAETAFKSAQDGYARLEKLFKDGAAPQSRLDEARALRDAAKAAMETYRLSLEMAEKGARKEDLEIAKASVAAAESQVKSLSATLAHASISAPFDGVINQRLLDIGEFAGVGESVFEVIGAGPRKVEIEVPATLISQVSQAREIVLSIGGRTLEAKILKVHPAVSAMTRMGKVEVVPVGSVEMIVGGIAEVSFTTALTGETLTIPRKCVLSPDKSPYVWISENGSVAMRPVKLGASSREKFEILEGLTGAEKVLITGQTMVDEGGKYEVRDFNGAAK